MNYTMNCPQSQVQHTKSNKSETKNNTAGYTCGIVRLFIFVLPVSWKG